MPIVDPFREAMLTYQSYRSIQQSISAQKINEAKSEKIEAEKKQGLKLQDDLAMVVRKPNPTARDYLNMMAGNPQLSEHYKQSFDLMTSHKKQVTQARATRLLGYLKAGQTEFAIESLEEQKLAAENAGLTGEARGAEAILALVGTDTKAAMDSVALFLASTMGGSQFASVLNKVNASTEAQYRVLTPEEKKDWGLDANKAFQIGLDRKITTIGGGGVNISVGEKRFGTIPPGFQLRTVGDKTFMEAIPGSPAEAKAKALVVKKAQGSTLENRATNVVIEDIGRLKDKIENAPWYSPVTGIGGAALSNFPATGRVDAEALKQTISANVGFDRLQQMREASPTGGALGAISERELTTLEAVLGSLSLSQSEGQLVENLDRLNDIYGAILRKAKDYPNANEFGFSDTPITEAVVAPPAAPAAPSAAPVAQPGVAPAVPAQATPVGALSTWSPEELAAELARLKNL